MSKKNLKVKDTSLVAVGFSCSAHIWLKFMALAKNAGGTQGEYLAQLIKNLPDPQDN
jgi:hypothetical protein